jgi:hypothetical protein
LSAKVEIQTAADLLAALSGGNVALVMAALRTTRRDPARALAFGSSEGRDVIDALVELAGGRGTLAMAAAETLSAFEDKRVARCFLGLLAGASGSMLDLVTGCLLGRRHQFARAELYPVLMENASAARVRAAWRLLETPTDDSADRNAAARREDVDPPEVVLRLALLENPSLPGEVESRSLPPLDDAWKTSWRAELDGVLVGEARAALRALGRPAFDWLTGGRRQLSPSNAAWLLAWGAERWPDDSVERVDEALRDPARVRLGLACVEGSPRLVPLLREALAEVARSADPRLRARAVRAGAVLDWDRAVREDGDAEVRAACLQRWGTDAPLGVLLDALRDDDWRVRAASSDALAARGGADVLDAVRPLLHDPSDPARAAAVQVLSALGEADAVEEELLAP